MDFFFFLKRSVGNKKRRKKRILSPYLTTNTKGLEGRRGDMKKPVQFISNNNFDINFINEDSKILCMIIDKLTIF